MTDTATEITVETILENRRRWAEALRSGEYEQGHSQLVNHYGEENPSYCCLGVATILCGGDLINPKKGKSHLYAGLKTIEELGLVEDAALTAVLDRAGRQVTLSVLNDSYGFTFAEIADLIDDGQVLLSVPGDDA